jgi:hypothetical protein
MVSWFVPQNLAGYSLSVASQNRREDEDGAGHTSRSSSLLCMEANRARVSQFASKPTEARQQVVHVALSWRLHRDQVKNGWVNATGCIGPCYPYFVIFIALGLMGILVFCLGL